MFVSLRCLTNPVPLTLSCFLAYDLPRVYGLDRLFPGGLCAEGLVYGVVALRRRIITNRGPGQDDYDMETSFKGSSTVLIDWISSEESRLR